MSLEDEDTYSLLDELEAAARLNEASLSSDADDTNAASIIAAAMAGASGGGFEYAAPPDTVALVTTGDKASESTQQETAAAAVGGDEATPRSPMGSLSSASKTSAPSPSGKVPAMVRAGTSGPPRSAVPQVGGTASGRSASAPPPTVAPSGGSPAPPSPFPVAASLATPSPSRAAPVPAGAHPSNRERLVAAVGTDIDMVDPAKLATAVASLLEAAVATVAQLSRQYDIVMRRLETCADSDYDQWQRRAETVVAQQSLEESWMSYLRAQRSTADLDDSSGSSQVG